ncbi:MAG: hypothetical protein DFNUSKGM_001186 [Candidatus Fervidibacter sacchari]|jgi:hypothetical protein
MAEQQTAKPETTDEELERLKKMGEEIYERIRHKIGDVPARTLIDFTLLARQRLPTAREIADAMENLSKGMPMSDAKVIIKFILEWAERKHGLRFR